jgi:hypothetical protein
MQRKSLVRRIDAILGPWIIRFWKWRWERGKTTFTVHNYLSSTKPQQGDDHAQ